MNKFNENFMEALITEMLLEPSFTDKLLKIFKECFEKAVKETSKKYEDFMLDSMYSNLISSIDDPRLSEHVKLLHNVLNLLDQTTLSDPILYYRIMNNTDNQLMIINLYMVQLKLINEPNLTDDTKIELMKSCIDRLKPNLIDIDFSKCIPECKNKNTTTIILELYKFNINNFEYTIYVAYEPFRILQKDYSNIIIILNDIFDPNNPINSFLTDNELESIKNICIEDATNHKE